MLSKQVSKVVGRATTSGNLAEIIWSQLASSVNSNPLYASAVTAVQAGLAATARKYAELDSATAKKNPVRGTIPYDNDKSVFYN